MDIILLHHFIDIPPDISNVIWILQIIRLIARYGFHSRLQVHEQIFRSPVVRYFPDIDTEGETNRSEHCQQQDDERGDSQALIPRLIGVNLRVALPVKLQERLLNLFSFFVYT